MLIVGGELIVGGAASLAAAMKIPLLVIGLTVVAFGTSSPELAVSLQSVYAPLTVVTLLVAIYRNLR